MDDISFKKKKSILFVQMNTAATMVIFFTFPAGFEVSLQTS